MLIFRKNELRTTAAICAHCFKRNHIWCVIIKRATAWLFSFVLFLLLLTPPPSPTSLTSPHTTHIKQVNYRLNFHACEMLWTIRQQKWNKITWICLSLWAKRLGVVSLSEWVSVCSAHAMSTRYSFIIEFLINGGKLFLIQNSKVITH